MSVEVEGPAAGKAEPSSPDSPDLWAEVERELFEEPEPVPAPAPAPRPVVRARFRIDRRVGWAAGAAAGLALLGLATWSVVGLLNRSEPRRLRLTTTTPDRPVRGAALSADGETLAFADADGLHLSPVGAGRRRSITLPDGAVVGELAWSPEGQQLYAAARRSSGFEESLWFVPLDGSAPRKLREDAGSPAISADGSRLAFVQASPLGKSIWVMASDGSGAELLLADEDHDYLHPAWSPDGRRLAFVRASKDFLGASLMTRGVAGGEPEEVTLDFDLRTGPCWTPEGELLFGRRTATEASLWKVPIDPDTGAADDDPVQLTSIDGASHLAHLSVSADGRRVGFTAVRTRVDTYVAELASGELTPRRLTSGSGDHWPVAWVGGGDSLLLNVEREKSSEIVLQPMRDEAPRTIGAGRVWAVTSGGEMLCGTRETRTSQVLRLSSSDGQPEPLGELPVHAINSRSTFRCPQRSGAGCVLGLKTDDVLYLHAFDPRSASGKGSLRAKVGLTGRDYGWNVSPDGRRAAVVNGGRLIKLVDLRNARVRKLTLRPSVYSQGVAWASDGRSLYVTGMIMHSAGGYVLYRVDLAGRARELWRTTDRWFDEPVVSPDGRRLALASRTIEGDAWVWGDVPQ